MTEYRGGSRREVETSSAAKVAVVRTAAQQQQQRGPGAAAPPARGGRRGGVFGRSSEVSALTAAAKTHTPDDALSPRTPTASCPPHTSLQTLNWVIETTRRWSLGRAALETHRTTSGAGTLHLAPPSARAPADCLDHLMRCLRLRGDLLRSATLFACTCWPTQASAARLSRGTCQMHCCI